MLKEMALRSSEATNGLLLDSRRRFEGTFRSIFTSVRSGLKGRDFKRDIEVAGHVRSRRREL